jgi:hypothetical protein
MALSLEGCVYSVTVSGIVAGTTAVVPSTAPGARSGGPGGGNLQKVD